MCQIQPAVHLSFQKVFLFEVTWPKPLERSIFILGDLAMRMARLEVQVAAAPMPSKKRIK